VDRLLYQLVELFWAELLEHIADRSLFYCL
jgi:hypothetical protein